MKWVDGGKAIFKVSTNVVSTVYTQVRPPSGFLQSLLTFFVFTGLLILWWTGDVSRVCHTSWSVNAGIGYTPTLTWTGEKRDRWMALYLFFQPPYLCKNEPKWGHALSGSKPHRNTLSQNEIMASCLSCPVSAFTSINKTNGVCWRGTEKLLFYLHIM